MNKLFTSFLIAIHVVVFAILPARAQDDYKPPEYSSSDGFVPVVGKNGMVSARESIATQVGADILAQGGNAIDAAAAVGFALAVTYPSAGNIGGGGFMVVHLADKNETVAIDYREMSAGTARHDLYVVDGKVDNRLAKYSRQSSGVPGTVMGMAHAIEKYGTMSLKEIIEPAYKLAKEGFPVYTNLEVSLNRSKRRLGADPAAAEVFYKPDGSTYRAGELLVQEDLAWSLKQIMDHGTDAFYKGEIAERITADMAANDGLLTMEDFAAYKVYEREPVMGTYKDYTIATMPPPSSGGMHMVQMMNMLEHDDLKSKGHNSAATLHLYIEAMRQAYADRSLYAGDPAFFNVPVDKLIDKDYAAEVRARIPMDRARESSEVAPTKNLAYESPETTHYSVMDKWGNAVSNTYTLNFGYGNGIMAANTGILLNNELDDFDHEPYKADENGNVSGKANAQEPHKRPRSSMTPTIVLKDGKPFLVTGSPGGGTIINTVFQMVMNVIEFDMNVAAASSKPRINHQWMPDATSLENGISQDTINILEGMGHKLNDRRRTLGSMNSIVWRDGWFYGSHDPRNMNAGTIGLE
ncbi:gamma-glutamyltransferase [Pseudemcibacter aquimaris]|uniref:gamma-glutamyltransferase n=1 Tax=Pseudemcibacter aquimaris TaxID=2857064 RepID=UPI002011073A|nr:gamma-glutamyltransferase [Pseudemcibacter aquimaris]MCC3860245.1 gamma-glutamyltransferase [Pseudemcibacter aquimaris]WDU57570.1 gamma-glutamyltransferase [Pseudemcibacter aquimaris]